MLSYISSSISRTLVRLIHFIALTAPHIKSIQARDDGTYYGSGFVSDESPPNANRYTGLRFQITQVYNVWFHDKSTWDSDAFATEYPIQSRERRLMDIVNVPGKTGADTLKAINSQTERVGVYNADYVSGTGDGGGENEGAFGVHALLEESNPDYAARRCLPHFSWRTFTAGTKAMNPHFKKGVALNTYLRQQITWSRLQAIAVQPKSSGGLGLFTATSAECRRVFGHAPPKLIDERPEATLDYNLWLVERQDVLTPLVAHDLASRSLEGTWGKDGLETLESLRDNICRRIDIVLMKKSLFLFYWTKGINYISEQYAFADLVTRTVDQLLSTRLTDDVLEVLGLTREELVGIGVVDDTTTHWIEVAVSLCVNDMSGIHAWLPMAMEYHRDVSVAMASHVRATAENIERQYMAGGGS